MPPMRRLYLDNAATSFPKPPAVIEAMARYARELGASPGRGAYAEAIEAGRLVSQCRGRIATLINGESPDHIVFTLNATDALNLALKGIVNHHRRRRERVHILTTSMDHNSVLRPFTALQRDGVETARVPVDPQSGLVDPADVKNALTRDTRLVAILHGSNVSGTIQPAAAIGAICREAGVPFLLDAAQTLGHMPLDVQALNVDLLAFPGHKGLLGPLGTGGLYLRPGMEKVVDTQREGGTGTASELDVQPETMPDKYEPGSHNAIGIIGLSEGVKWILDRGVESIWSHEQALMRLMLEGLRDMRGVRLLGPRTSEQRCGVFSIVMDGIEPGALANVLEVEYGVLVRAGLHCAPLAHRTMGTSASGGAVRLSLGPFLSEDDVRYAMNALMEIAQEAAAVRA